VVSRAVVDFVRVYRLTPEPTEPAVVLGDCNLDGNVDFSDIGAFIEALQSGSFLEQADCNLDGEVNFSDIGHFIEILAGS